ncbi:hypothetical protein GWK08_13325 [Leptobacterium flavescens]|uniref:Multidrug transporter n=1 Tax=Leptobacterium flavescens TaxID=472055 RepID=A0A6P0URM1_9FLAO|nr:bestrophin family ion channel [Leptobacterium flavescens]NER14429.1 hypothetical protein [Leptobacterium flavescens]
MYIKRNLDLKIILRFAWRNLLFFALWAGAVYSAYFYLGWKFIDIPFQPLSVIGIAVAFYVGFKNSQSYDRFWEARKIWGGIVNSSRTWGNQVISLVEADHKVKKELIYRQLAWINALRIQLRQSTSFTMKENPDVERLVNRHGEQNPACDAILPFVEEEEFNQLKKRKNVATHLIKDQGLAVRQLLKEEKITEFDKQIFHSTLEELYTLQGKCERIKNTPFPRQYAYFSTVFTWIFILLLPFGLLSVFESELSELKTTFTKELFLILMIPFSVLISWIFITMEKVGSNSEDPFEGRINDVPMTALCRTIEIDLRDMLDEEELPEKIQPKDNILY